MGAARRADRAGDVRAARRFLELAAEKKRQRQPLDEELRKAALVALARKKLAEKQAAKTQGPPEPPEGYFMDPVTGAMTSRELLKNRIEPSRRRAAAGGAFQGATFQWGDEALGLAGGSEDDRRFNREFARAALEKDSEAYPWTSGGAEIAGAITSAMATAPLTAAKTGLGLLARGVGLGAAEGALYGSGRGEGAEDRGEKAMDDAAMGGLLGAVAPKAISSARHVYGLGRGLLSSIADVPDHVRANAAIAKTINRSGKSADEVAQEVAQAALEGQPEFRAMDAMGDAGARRASGIARSADGEASRITEFLERRQMDQGSRVARFIEEGFDTGGDTAAKREAALIKMRSDTANAAYDAARDAAGPVDVRGAIDVINARIGGMANSGVAGDGIDGRLSRVLNRLEANASSLGQGETRRTLSDFDRVLGVKQDVGDMMGEALRAGRNNEYRELKKVHDALDKALETGSDAYRAANDGFAKASREIDAISQGAEMSRPGARADDTVARFRSMTPEQQAQARVGYADRALAKIEANPSPTADRSKPFRSTKGAAEARAMAVNPDTFTNRMHREGAMWNTQNKAIQGSRTAQNQADIDEVGQAAAGLPSVMRSAGNLSFGDAAASILRPVMDATVGMNNKTRTLIAQALMSDNPKEALNIAIRQEMGAEQRQRLISAIARSAGLRVNAQE
ncbi:hypothetical protein MAA5396_04763 [Marinovum algicola]|uniref:Uncharacterized protein n=2 Tax=Marinovum algicola TaxID=42444 RepID=A0A975ZQQ3_9RHOB|nr:hypothetical protein SAMN04487940_12624 [Marinovum algicola]SLN76585.1 hypothetical protein MAA5396_04763 [Marinovum algicola]